MNPMISELRTDLSFAFRTMSADAIHAKRLLVLLHGVGGKPSTASTSRRIASIRGAVGSGSVNTQIDQFTAI